MEHLTHMTKEKRLKPRRTSPADQIGQHFKPMGLWYAIGTAWWEWCSSEMEHWVSPYIYTFEILADSNVLRLDTPEAVLEFSRKYGIPVYRHMRYIDWQRVTKNYDGVEFNPYFYGQRFASETLWYNGIDVPSGVIFNPDIIQNITKYRTKEYLQLQ